MGTGQSAYTVPPTTKMPEGKCEPGRSWRPEFSHVLLSGLGLPALFEFGNELLSRSAIAAATESGEAMSCKVDFVHVIVGERETRSNPGRTRRPGPRPASPAS